MARADTEIRAFLGTPVPDDAEDLRDLGVIGYANQLPGVTAAQLADLIDAALSNGRSWDDIGRRLGMTAEEARTAYEKLKATPPPRSAAHWRQLLAGLIRAIQDALDNVLDRAAAGIEGQRVRRW